MPTAWLPCPGNTNAADMLIPLGNLRPKTPASPPLSSDARGPVTKRKPSRNQDKPCVLTGRQSASRARLRPDGQPGNGDARDCAGHRRRSCARARGSRIQASARRRQASNCCSPSSTGCAAARPTRSVRSRSARASIWPCSSRNCCSGSSNRARAAGAPVASSYLTGTMTGLLLSLMRMIKTLSGAVALALRPTCGTFGRHVDDFTDTVVARFPPVDLSRGRALPARTRSRGRQDGCAAASPLQAEW